MLNCNDEAEEDVFFDSVESIRSCDSLYVEGSGSVSGRISAELDYDIWINEPRSIQERRDRFIRGMGLAEFVPLKPGCVKEAKRDLDIGWLVQCPNLERVTECSGAVSSSLGEEQSPFRGDPDPDPDYAMKFVASVDAECRSYGGTVADESNSELREASAHCEEHGIDYKLRGKKVYSWLKRLLCQSSKKRMIHRTNVFTEDCKTPKINKMKVQHKKKRYMEFSAVYMGQEIQAHKGFIRAMKFSPDGQYLASGGEDGVVRIWRVTSMDASCKSFSSEGNSEFVDKAKGSKLLIRRKSSRPASVVIPKKVFKIEESPLHEFYGHTSDVLDLCWSKSNCLLSSSKDKTVRLWQVGVDGCNQVFPHNNYVTCIQFNPVFDGYFISGSIDGKVRIWSVAESRVVDWADVRDIVTAICYQPDGKGFVVGSISGDCRFYDVSDNQLLLDVQISVAGKKKSSTNRITGLQFSPESPHRVMITSADSKVRIFDGVDVIHKYNGLRNSGSQKSASFTSNGRHIVSVDEDSHVYVWNYDSLHSASRKSSKSIRSCEHFSFEGVSVAIPWCERETKKIGLDTNNLEYSTQKPKNLECTSLLVRDSDRFCLNGWFAMDERLKGSATWPEEKLPSLDASTTGEHDNFDLPYHSLQEEDGHNLNRSHVALSSSWGVVIVTAGVDGIIRTFHNYGLPIRL
ncbi:hypothetical protein Sjap_018498 [Stephania japonica]|uniref:Uncharacterized protein n=1 Tax=Stephania japonica TaxID=461633 RepID=A0AAP0NKK6_9MAGN